MGTIKAAADGRWRLYKTSRNSHCMALARDHSLMLSRPTNLHPPLVNSKIKRIGALSRSSGVSLKGAIDLIPPVGFFVLFGAFKTLCGIGLAFENFVVTAREVLPVLHGFDLIGHRQWKFRHLRDRRFFAGDNRRLKFLPECRKVGLRKHVWK